MEESIKTAKSELWSLSLRDLFYKYVRFLPIFVLSVAVALFGAYAYLRYATPVYSTGGTLIIQSETKGGGRGDKFEDIFGGGKSQNIQSEIEILKSKPLMARVVNKLNLQYSYFVIGKIKTINIYKYGPFVIEASELTDSSRSFTLKIKFVNNQAFKVNDDNTLITFGRFFKNQFGTFRLIRQGGTVAKDYTITYQSTASAAGAYAGAFMDIVYDHFLALDSEELSKAGWKDFAEEVYEQLTTQQSILPEKFARMLPYMTSQNWLFNYRFTQGIQHSFGGLARRAQYLTDSGAVFALFTEHYNKLEKYYRDFFPDVKKFAQSHLAALLIQ